MGGEGRAHDALRRPLPPKHTETMKVKFQDRKGREFAVVLETAELEIESTLPGDSISRYSDGKPHQVGDTSISWSGNRVSRVDDISISSYSDGKVHQIGRMSISWSGNYVSRTNGTIR